MKEEFRAARSNWQGCGAVRCLPGSEFDLWYFDEAGFTLQPSIPYAWQMVGRDWLASAHGARQKRCSAFSICINEFILCLRKARLIARRDGLL
ncbi:MAG: hypothetical protein KIT57_05005 [Blastocatellales bacterium]|nr:hypothetical protein [Blastocatellales bacterium]